MELLCHLHLASRICLGAKSDDPQVTLFVPIGKLVLFLKVSFHYTV